MDYFQMLLILCPVFFVGGIIDSRRRRLDRASHLFDAGTSGADGLRMQ